MYLEDFDGKVLNLFLKDGKFLKLKSFNVKNPILPFNFGYYGMEVGIYSSHLVAAGDLSDGRVEVVKDHPIHLVVAGACGL